MRSFSRKENKINRSQTNQQCSNDCLCQGKLFIVGIGPGEEAQLTERARQVLETSEVIVGYKRYIELIRPIINSKQIISTAMTQEVERVQIALDKAHQGSSVALISSGDPGVYGMAGLALEMLEKGQSPDVEIIPGVTAACACAALLGAPLMHDYVTISLSDRLTDLALIMKRIKLAVEGDFVIVLYNPRAKKRTKPFAQACQILMRHKSLNTPVGIVKAAFRQSQRVSIISLGELSASAQDIDMTTTIFIGNSTTVVENGKMITPRGYKKKVA